MTHNLTMLQFFVVGHKLAKGGGKSHLFNTEVCGFSRCLTGLSKGAEQRNQPLGLQCLGDGHNWECFRS
jgi:hypothetical protein